MEHIVIIGGGGTGAALAHDLVLRGFQVSLYERGELLSGATGRHHGLLHSGGRYAVNDPVAAKECVRENNILRRIAPEAIEQNDGLFVAFSDTDMDYRPSFLEQCGQCEIPTEELTAAQALAMEPALHPELIAAIRVRMPPWMPGGSPCIFMPPPKPTAPGFITFPKSSAFTNLTEPLRGCAFSIIKPNANTMCKGICL